jgi:hypothetical protein
MSLKKSGYESVHSFWSVRNPSLILNNRVRLLLMHRQWADKILLPLRPKVIEVRHTSLRESSFGRIGIQVAAENQVIGAVNVTGCTCVAQNRQREILEAARTQHLLSSSDIEQFLASGKPLYFWHLAGARRFDQPIAHKVKRGVQTFEVIAETEPDFMQLHAQIYS